MSFDHPLTKLAVHTEDTRAGCMVLALVVCILGLIIGMLAIEVGNLRERVEALEAATECAP